MRFDAPSSQERSSSAAQGYAVGHGIVAPASGWSFGGDVWQSFDAHIRASVPGYDALHDTVLELASGFLVDGGRALDVGSATGTLTCKLAQAFPASEVIGIDVEPNMIRRAKRLGSTRPHYVCSAVQDLDFGRLNFAAVCYTLMFVAPAERPAALDRIRHALLPGAGLVLAEKVKHKNPLVEARARAEHHAFKRAQGLSEAEIQAKAASVRGSLIPLGADDNLAMLRRAGFRDIRLVSRHSCFQAWFAIRG